ncbi:hypothetical protein ACFQI7_03475 [Paenibacillus allorhizosphaerae]|uniref:DUF4025 domain-containing protein n=1 Tax=Paenibacillus allorhizosphaerae TaxID=2849866 RepID=A0ABN7TE37_9BACL|nr:hypothetical protein [Paenibacillus allorhizosphaerae]CAG7625103.1 hypothetical protein PAECIP111802_01132 [Paenibacillus allorhizosphaerae]
MAKYNDEHAETSKQEENALTNDNCAVADLGQIDAPADAFADQDEYIDEP